MSNLCSRVGTPSYVTTTSPTTLTGGGGFTSQKVYTSGPTAIGNDVFLMIPVGGAFDADALGITCQAFANAQVSVTSLQTAMAAMQSQLETVVSMTKSDTNPLNIDLESAVAISGAILMLWAVAFVLRMARKLLETKESEPES